MRLWPLLGCIALAVTGCSDPDTLTCEWLASTKNCWGNTAAMATTCLPPESEQGTFSTDNAMCTYPSGSVVNFTPAVMLPLPDDPVWNFTVNSAGGQACLHYEENASGAKLVVGADTVNVSFSGLSESISCPDGSSVKVENALNLLNCPGSIGALPGHFIGYSDTSVTFGIIGTMDATTVPVFDCTK